MNNSINQSKMDNFLKSEWKNYIFQKCKLAIYEGLLLLVLSLFFTGFRFDLLGKFAIICSVGTLAIFLILTIFEILPNFIFFQKKMRDGEKEFLIKNIKEHGMLKLTRCMWFIWPRDLGGNTGKGPN